MSKKKVIKKTKPNYLKPNELLKMESDNNKFLFNLEKMKGKQKDIKILEMKMQLIQQEMAGYKKDLLVLKNDTDASKIIAEENYKTLTKKYRLPENGWTYNDNDGQIIIEKE